MTLLTRRRFLTLAAPAIVVATNIMPVRALAALGDGVALVAMSHPAIPFGLIPYPPPPPDSLALFDAIEKAEIEIRRTCGLPLAFLSTRLEQARAHRPLFKAG